MTQFKNEGNGRVIKGFVNGIMNALIDLATSQGWDYFELSQQVAGVSCVPVITDRTAVPRDMLRKDLTQLINTSINHEESADVAPVAPFGLRDITTAASVWLYEAFCTLVNESPSQGIDDWDIQQILTYTWMCRDTTTLPPALRAGSHELPWERFYADRSMLTSTVSTILGYATNLALILQSKTTNELRDGLSDFLRYWLDGAFFRSVDTVPDGPAVTAREWDSRSSRGGNKHVAHSLTDIGGDSAASLVAKSAQLSVGNPCPAGTVILPTIFLRAAVGGSLEYARVTAFNALWRKVKNMHRIQSNIIDYLETYYFAVRHEISPDAFTATEETSFMMDSVIDGVVMIATKVILRGVEASLAPYSV